MGHSSLETSPKMRFTISLLVVGILIFLICAATPKLYLVEVDEADNKMEIETGKRDVTEEMKIFDVNQTLSSLSFEDGTDYSADDYQGQQATSWRSSDVTGVPCCPHVVESADLINCQNDNDCEIRLENMNFNDCLGNCTGAGPRGRLPFDQQHPLIQAAIRRGRAEDYYEGLLVSYNMFQNNNVVGRCYCQAQIDKRRGYVYNNRYNSCMFDAFCNNA